MNDIIVGTMQWCGKSTSQPTDKGQKKGDMGRIKKRKPTPKQYPSQIRNEMQRMKTQELIYAAIASLFVILGWACLLSY